VPADTGDGSIVPALSAASSLIRSFSLVTLPCGIRPVCSSPVKCGAITGLQLTEERMAAGMALPESGRSTD